MRIQSNQKQIFLWQNYLQWGIIINEHNMVQGVFTWSCSQYRIFSVHARKTTLKSGSIATDCHHNFKQKNVNHSYIFVLTANKLFYTSIIGLCLEFLPEIMSNVYLILRNFFRTMKVSMSAVAEYWHKIAFFNFIFCLFCFVIFVWIFSLFDFPHFGFIWFIFIT